MDSHRVIFLIDVASTNFKQDDDNSQGCEELRLCCLRLLLFFRRAYKCSFKWGFKFFNSEGSTLQRMDRYPFKELNLESFEDFEFQVLQHVNQFRDLCKALKRNTALQSVIRTSSQTSGCNDVSLSCCTANILKLALMQVLCNYEWDAPDMTVSPVLLKSRKTNQKCIASSKESGFNNNCVFILSKVPYSYDSVLQFMGIKKEAADTESVNPVSLLNSFMPPSLLEKFRTLANARLFWVDLQSLDKKDNTGDSCVHKALQAINGKVISVNSILQHSVLTNSVYALNFQTKPDEAVLAGDLPAAGHSESSVYPVIPPSAMIHYYLNDTNGKAENDGNKKYDNQLKQLSPPKVTLVMSLPHETTLCTLHVVLPHQISEISCRNESGTCLNNAQEADKNSAMLPSKNDLVFDWKQMIILSYVQECRWLNFPVESGSVTYICYLPSNTLDEESAVYTELIQQMSAEHFYMVIECTGSSCNPNTLAILRPLTAHSCTLYMLKTVDVLKWERNMLASSISEDPFHSGKRGRPRHRMLSRKIERVVELDRLHQWGSFDVEKTDTAPHSITGQESVFNAQIFEDWFVPCRMDDIQSTQDFCDDRLKKMLDKLQKYYKSQSASQIHQYQASIKPDISQVGSTEDAEPSTLLKRSNLSSNCNGTTSGALQGKPRKKNRISSPDSLNIPVSCNEEELLLHLQRIYIECQDAVNAAQTIANLVLHHMKHTNHNNPNEGASEYLLKNFMFSIPKINEKYSNFPKETKNAFQIREYKLQSAIVLESLLLKSCSELLNCAIEKVVSFLRAISFLAGPDHLYKFLTEDLKTNYSNALADLLIAVGEELNVNMSPGAPSPSSPASGIDSPSSTCSGQPSSALSQLSFVSSRSSRSSYPEPVNQERWKFSRHPSLLYDQHQRQISVPRSIITRSRSAQIKGSTASNMQSKSLMRNSRSNPETTSAGSSKDGCRQVKRKLFSPQKTSKKLLHTRSVSEYTSLDKSHLNDRKGFLLKKYAPDTPQHKQGKTGISRRLSCFSHKLGLEQSDVEESPDKAVVGAQVQQSTPADAGCNHTSCFDSQNSNFGIKECEVVVTKDKQADLLTIATTKRVSPRRFFSKLMRTPSRKREREKVKTILTKEVCSGALTNDMTHTSEPQPQCDSQSLLNSPYQNTRLRSRTSPQFSSSPSQHTQRQLWHMTNSHIPNKECADISLAKNLILYPKSAGPNVHCNSGSGINTSTQRVKQKILKTPDFTRKHVSSSTPSPKHSSSRNFVAGSPFQNTRSKTDSPKYELLNRSCGSPKHRLRAVRRNLMKTCSITPPKSKEMSTNIQEAHQHHSPSLNTRSKITHLNNTRLSASFSISECCSTGLNETFIVDNCLNMENQKHDSPSPCSEDSKSNSIPNFSINRSVSPDKKCKTPPNEGKSQRQRKLVPSSLQCSETEICVNQDLNYKGDLNCSSSETPIKIYEKSDRSNRRTRVSLLFQNNELSRESSETGGPGSAGFTPPSALSLIHLTTSPMVSSTSSSQAQD